MVITLDPSQFLLYTGRHLTQSDIFQDYHDLY